MLKSMVAVCVVVAGFSVRPALANCGSCASDAPAAAATSAPANLLKAVGDAGAVNGLVLASCGMCNFGMKDQKGCSLAIKIGETAFPVDGTKITDHGDAHSKGGLCTTVRVASVTGTIKDKVFTAESFEVQKN